MDEIALSSPSIEQASNILSTIENSDNLDSLLIHPVENQEPFETFDMPLAEFSEPFFLARVKDCRSQAYGLNQQRFVGQHQKTEALYRNRFPLDKQIAPANPDEPGSRQQSFSSGLLPLIILNQVAPFLFPPIVCCFNAFLAV